MTKKIINTGTVPNDKSGDSLRSAGGKINDNFNEIYNAIGNGSIPTLAAVAKSGLYSDLSGAPSLNTFNIVSVPSSLTSPGQPRDVALGAIDGINYLYVCIATNLWKSIPLYDDPIVLVTPPNNLYGKSGDRKGLIAIDSNTLYICTGNYVNNTTNIWAAIPFDSQGGPSGSSDSLVNGEATLSLSDTGVLTLPQGSLIGEMLVTDNPTVVIQPANPEHESQLLYIKGGVPGFSNSENGITISIENTLTYQNGDVVYINVYTGLPEGTTLYWWVDGNQFQPDNGVITLDQFGGASFDFTVIDGASPFVVYVADTLYNAYVNNLGAVSLAMNTDVNYVDTSVHLHLTTGDLTQTSIFLGTDNHNVRTKANGSIELTSYDYDIESAYRLNFNKNVLSIDSDNNPGNEDLYLKAGDDLYLDALDDDIHIRARDDIRIRPGYDFGNDEYAWQYRFVESDGAMTVSDYNYQYGAIYPVFNDQDNDRGLALESDGSTYVKSQYGNYTWKFDKNGNLIFPNGTTQTTAWNGTVLSSAPISSLGQSGDVAGMIAADSNYLYYCTQDYGSNGFSVTTFASTPIVAWIDATDYPGDLVADFNINPVGWTYNGVTITSVEVDSTYGSGYIIGANSSFNVFNGDSYALIPPSTLSHIWKRVAWSNDTW